MKNEALITELTIKVNEVMESCDEKSFDRLSVPATIDFFKQGFSNHKENITVKAGTGQFYFLRSKYKDNTPFVQLLMFPDNNLWLMSSRYGVQVLNADSFNIM